VFLITGIALVTIGVILYWFFPSGNSPGDKKNKPSLYLVGLYLASVVLLVWSGFTSNRNYYEHNVEPLAIAIALDLSPSMLAIPDPGSSPGAKPRYERGLQIVRELFRRLEESQVTYMISIIGFTTSAQVVMGWENNPSQITEMLEYIISPELFTSSGTSMEAAVNGMVGVFKLLPRHFQNNSRNIGIIVSDGEDSSTFLNLSHMTELLRKEPLDIIALQTGYLDVDEGVPRLGEFGEYFGFQPMGGRLYTVPDVETMMEIANAGSRGLYIRAENPDSAVQIMNFIGVSSYGMDIDYLGVVFGLWLVVLLICLRFVW